MITAIKGMNDIRPGASEAFLDTAIWERLFKTAKDVLESYGYKHVWLPIVEDTALFARGIGEDTDIVSKEMYTFTDRGERSMTLRPEGTAGAVRAFIEHHVGRHEGVTRWWYAGPMFRAERPQKGRYRQFYQIGAELFGVPGYGADAEMLLMLDTLCKRLGLHDIKIRVNSLGDSESRQRYREMLQVFLRARSSGLCESCNKRIETNPLRVLDCKRPACKEIVAEAPDIKDALTPAAAEHFDKVQELLAQAGVQTERDRRLVRGLDYYTGVIFEFTTGALGSQDAVLGGGRYDALTEELGGAATPAVGFAAGVERLALLLSAQGVAAARPHLYLAPMDGTLPRALGLAEEVRAAGPYVVEVDLSEKRVKNMLQRADKLAARHVIVLGEQELASGMGKIKDLSTSVEREVKLTGAAIGEVL